jgi:hypothetical protein
MGLRYNPFNGSFDFTRSPGSYLDGEVATFADLPLGTAAAPLNSAWLVRAGSGLWLLTRKPAGIYIRTATGGTDRNADYTYASAFPDVFSDANFTVYDDADSTRSMQIQVTDNETLTFKVTGSDSIVRSVAFPLSAILLAAVMFASSALAQNIGIVTATNNNIVTGRTGTLTWTNALAFGTNAATVRTNLGLGETNNVIFSNVTASGTLTATGNVTMSGTANTAPSQTASSGASLMTRELSDVRYLGLKSHWLNFATFTTRTASGGVSSSSRGAWQIFTATNVSSFASAWAAWGYLLGLDPAQQHVNFTNPFTISFSRLGSPTSLLRAGLFQYVQLGRDVITLSATNTKLAQKGLGIQFASNGVTPFVHNGTTLTDGSLITNISTYNRFVLRWVPATAFEVYGVANGSEPVLLGSVTSNLPSGISASDAALEFMQLDSGSGGANAWLYLNSGYVITP